ncbi:lipocalin family protein [Glaciecola siphonariae]|uniref:Outer membrane lipoprotein Blc n=1 Tax=Glaciecola siphonariae TaxID=521012 RepID=A0ABV9LZ31_9ALTE
MHKLLMISVFIAILSSCTGIPQGVTPVTGFEKERYLGTWYEIARLDHSFERGLEQVTATYSEQDDGGIKVINRGFNPKKNEWKTAEGKAYFVNEDDVGHLKVSFFGPFYASYVIIELDKKDYEYALVSGPDTDYLWILSRQPVLSKDIVLSLESKAASLGFDTSALIYVNQG